MVTMLDASRLVEDGRRHFGRFAHTPLANPLDAARGPVRAYEWFRTKEWVGFTLLHPELACSMIMQDAKYLATSEIYVFDRASQAFDQRSASRLGGSLRLPADLLHSACAFESSGYRLGYAFDADKVIVAVDIAPSDKGPAIRGRLSLDARRASPPLVVSARLPGGRMYTNKLLYPASGVLTRGDRRYVFDPRRDVAILDEHKSHLPYRTRWTWGTFAMPVASGGYAGANFAARPSEPGQPEESCIWTPEAAEPLADIEFTKTSGDRMAPWRIRSADGRLDVVFTPDGHKDEDQFLLVAEIHYTQWFGHYSGTLRGADRTWTVSGVPGVCEHMDARL